MIDRLEELLEQVEEPEQGGEAALLRQLRPANGLSVPGRATESGTETNVLPADPAAGEGAEAPAERLPEHREEAPLMRELTYTGAGSGLPELYRQIARAADGEGGGRSASVAVVRETVPEPASGLTAGELDLAMRRDSRRYDGGMTIY